MPTNKKISELEIIGSLDVADSLPIVDDSDPTPETQTKRVTIEQLDTRYLDPAEAAQATADAALPKAGGTMTGSIVLPGDPTLALEAATKQYVDNLVDGLKWKAAVRVATTTNGTLATAFANGQTIDGITLATGDRILIKNQSSQADNGIYIVAASGAPSRSSDANTWNELVSAAVYVQSGTTNGGTSWTCTIAPGGTLGVTDVTFAQTSGAIQVFSAVMASLSASAGTVANGDTLQQVINKLVGNTQNLSVINNLLTGFSASAGTVSSSDSVLTGLQKLQGTISTLDISTWPAFNAYFSAGTASFATNNSALKMQFNATTRNIGTFFDTSNNRATVPSGQAGDYQFGVAVQVAAANFFSDYYGIFYYVNGSLKNRFWSDFRSTAAKSAVLNGTSEILSLSVGDYVEVYFFGFPNNTASQITVYGTSTDGSIFWGKRIR